MVIAIIGILSGLIITTMSGATESARIAKLKVYSNSVRDTLGANLVSEWKFDDSSSLGKDSWGSNAGTLSGATIPQISTDCVSGSCLNFSGDDYVNCGKNDSLNIRDAVTISAWVKKTTHVDYAGVVGKGDVIMLLDDVSSPYSYYFILVDVDSGRGYANIPNVITLGGWNHIVATWSKGSAMKVYLNGILAVTGSVMTKQLKDSSADNLFIGSYLSTYNFNGSIDDVRIYNAAISGLQIQHNYLAGLNKLLANNGITKQEYNQRIVELNKNVAEK